MKKLAIIATLLGALAPNFAFAQTPTATGFTNGNNSRGDPNWVEASPSNPLPVAATITSGFLANGGYTTLTSTASSSSSTAIPTGTPTTASLRLTNNGTSEVSCTFATGAATGLINNTQIPVGSSVVRAVGTYNHVACINQAGDSASNVVVLESGTGLGNDSGGGSSGGSGSNASVGTTGAAVPASATYIGIIAGGNLTGWNGQVTPIQGGSVLSSTNPIFSAITDGTNKAAVKAASTAPVATDPAVVVGISPNSINANGSATSANSAPVVIAIDQSNVPVSPTTSGDPCGWGQKKSSVAIAITASGTAQLIALSGSTVIYVCGFHATVPNTATTSTSIKFVGGTGTNCGTLVSTFTGPMGSNDAAAVSANPTVVGNGATGSTQFATVAGNELCTVVTGNGTLDIAGYLTYVQL